MTLETQTIKENAYSEALSSPTDALYCLNLVAFFNSIINSILNIPREENVRKRKLVTAGNWGIHIIRLKYIDFEFEYPCEYHSYSLFTQILSIPIHILILFLSWMNVYWMTLHRECKSESIHSTCWFIIIIASEFFSPFFLKRKYGLHHLKFPAALSHPRVKS